MMQPLAMDRVPCRCQANQQQLMDRLVVQNPSWIGNRCRCGESWVAPTWDKNCVSKLKNKTKNRRLEYKSNKTRNMT
jgi:hypothetical protein